MIVFFCMRIIEIFVWSCYSNHWSKYWSWLSWIRGWELSLFRACSLDTALCPLFMAHGIKELSDLLLEFFLDLLSSSASSYHILFEEQPSLPVPVLTFLLTLSVAKATLYSFLGCWNFPQAPHRRQLLIVAGVISKGFMELPGDSFEATEGRFTSRILRIYADLLQRITLTLKIQYSR